MKRKDYQKPMMKVIQLQHQTQLLQASGGVRGNISVQNYNVFYYDE